MSQLALDLGVPSTLVTEAVYARSMSALKEERVKASKLLAGPRGAIDKGQKNAFIEQVRQALYASKICSYAQGFVQMRHAAEEMQWPLDYGRIALLWRGGCIIRARFLERIKEAFDANPKIENLLFAPYFKDVVERAQPAWRRVVLAAVDLGRPVPAFTTALTYYDSLREARLPHNLLQAQRDFFGAHEYERIDKPGKFHTDWLMKRRAPG
jgi:6-phosphogluconate dehydrogenase